MPGIPDSEIRRALNQLTAQQSWTTIAYRMGVPTQSDSISRQRPPSPAGLSADVIPAGQSGGAKMDFTLGWEFEATRIADRCPEEVELTHDGSVSGDGAEYRLRPGFVRDWSAGLLSLRQLLLNKRLRTDESCGFHVHIGLSRRTRRQDKWAAHFTALARYVEKEAFGAVPEERRNNDRYCRSWRGNNRAILGHEYHQNKYDNPERYYWLNPVEMFRPGGIRTVECRLMAAVPDYLYLASWIAACRIMAQGAWNLTADPSRLEEEADKCRVAFSRISTAFIRRAKPRSLTWTALKLDSGIAKFLNPGPAYPLRVISEIEKRGLFEGSANSEAVFEYFWKLSKEGRNRELGYNISSGMCVKYTGPSSIRSGLVNGNYYYVQRAYGDTLFLVMGDGHLKEVAYQHCEIAEAGIGRHLCAGY